MSEIRPIASTPKTPEPVKAAKRPAPPTLFIPPRVNDDKAAAPANPPEARKKKARTPHAGEGKSQNDAATAKLRQRGLEANNALHASRNPSIDGELAAHDSDLSANGVLTLTGVPVRIDGYAFDVDPDDKKDFGGGARLAKASRAAATRTAAASAGEALAADGEHAAVAIAVPDARKNPTPAISSAHTPRSVESLADSLPGGGESGIFEVLFPDGESMGVVVDSRRTQVSYLLSPSTGQFGATLQGERMELERCLARRIGRDVKVAVL